MIHFLDTVREKTQQRLRKSPLNLTDLRQQAQQARIPHDFLAVFSQPNIPFPIIAEIKFASPSAGILLSGTSALSIAADYLSNGAVALSILTEPTFFQGNLTFLHQIRNAHPDAYLLMKDFVLSEQQLLQARICGADAVLLIVAFLTEQELIFLYQKALELHLTPLIEVHTHAELMVALTLHPKLIGINNRNLHNLHINLEHSTELIRHIPADIISISESGIQSGAQLVDLTKLGFKGFLIGSHLMKTGHPGQALQTLLQQAHEPSSL